MKKKTHKKYVALLTMFAMVVCSMFCTNTAMAEIETSWEESDVVEVTKCTVNGSERTLTTLKNGRVFFQVDNQTPEYMCDFNYMIDVGIDKYSTIWYISNSDTAICWWNYDITGYENQVFKPIRDDSYSAIYDVESLIFDDNNLVIGYKTTDGESHPTLTFDEMKSYFPSYEGGEPTPTPVPTPTPTPVTPTPVPTANPTNTEKPVFTPEPTVSPQPTVSPKVSIKKSSGYTCLSVGNKVVSKYKLKKGVLTWKGTKKSKQIKQVKQAGFIKKSNNLIYITKKGKAYTISKNGKTKTILTKGATKLIIKNGYVTKIKKKTGYVDMTKKWDT